MLAPQFPLLTERLLLRPLDASTDVDAVHAYQSRADVCRYIPYEPRDRDAVAELLTNPDKGMRASLTEPGQAIDLAVVRRDTGRLIGEVMLFWLSAEHRSGELGYVLHPDHQGNGYMTEAAGAMLGLAFDGLQLHRVVARVDADNPASAAVLRRLGMRHEATLVENEWFKGRWSTEWDFGLLEDEWRAGQAG